MNCSQFDAHIDELLSGVLQPEASQHMRQCGRCTSHFRARTAVQNGLRALASAPPAGPSRATDRAVMDSYRHLQQRRIAAATTQPPDAAPKPAARLFSFPSRGEAARGSRMRWGGLGVAAALLAMAGSGIHMWNGVSSVSAPIVATAPAAPQGSANAGAAAVTSILASNTTLASNATRHLSELRVRLGAGRNTRSSGALLAVKARVSGNGNEGGAAQAVAADAAQQPAQGEQILHLASTGDAAKSAGSTWPGYSNLMYCDPVVCSGPMEVIHIKVPAQEVQPNQVQPSQGQGAGNSFVNADVLVGPDGVARAIRVAN